MSIYRGPGGSGDAVNDASSEATITVQAKDDALAAQTAAELAATNAAASATNAANSAASVNLSSIAITGGSINGTTVGATTASTGSFTTLAYTGTLTGGTGIVNLGSGQFYKDASGNIGVGTTSPNAKLHLYTSTATDTSLLVNNNYTGASGGIKITQTSTGEGQIYHVNAQPMLFGINNTERMRINSSGNVGIGTSSIAESTRLHVAGGRSNFVANSDAYAIGVGYASIGAYYIGANSANNALIFSDEGGSEKVRFDSAGNVGLGTSSPSASAILDAQSTTKGVRMPNMTTTQKNAISSPAAGLMVFDTTLAKLCVYSGSAWQTITSI